MHFIENIIEPSSLLLAWQAADEKHRLRYIVGELDRTNDEINLIYFSNSKDFYEAKNYGFEAYPAFQDVSKIYHHVLDAFMRRLPPRAWGDFTQYLESLRLKPDVKISDFGLLGYSSAKLLSDGFSLIHPFDNVHGSCELLLEAAGYRHLSTANRTSIRVGNTASFIEEKNQVTQETAIRIEVNNNHIGYVNKGLILRSLTGCNLIELERLGLKK